MCSKAPSLHGRYPASSLLRAWPPPSRLQSVSRLFRLCDLPGSTDFSMGRGRFLQLLSTVCHKYGDVFFISDQAASALGQEAAFDNSWAKSWRVKVHRNGL